MASRRWSMRNLLAMFDTSLDEILQRLEEGDTASAVDGARKMKTAVGRMKKFCENCDMDIVEGL